MSPYRVAAVITMRVPPHVVCPECGRVVIPDMWQQIHLAMSLHGERCESTPRENILSPQGEPNPAGDPARLSSDDLALDARFRFDTWCV